MNILVLSWRDPKHPLAGGAEQVMHEHIKGWLKAGHKVVFFASLVDGLSKEEILDGVKIIRRGYQHLGVQIAAFFWYVFGQHEKFDLVVDEFHGIPFFTPLYVREKKLAVLQEVARDVWLKNDLHWPFNWLIGTIGYFGEPLVYPFYRKVPFMVGSYSAKADLTRMGIPQGNINIVPHGVLLEKIRSVRKEKIATVVFLGALAKDKGIEDALRTFAILNKKGDFNFWVMGKAGEDYLQYLLELCKDLGLDNKVKFWGGRDKVDDRKKFELLSRSWVMLNPSIREGWGLVNIEANSVGVPVVAYKSPGLVDSVKAGQSGIFCKTNTPQAMAETILTILADKKEYQKLQRGAIRWSKNFTWAKSTKLSLTLLNRVVRVGRYE